MSKKRIKTQPSPERPIRLVEDRGGYDFDKLSLRLVDDVHETHSDEFFGIWVEHTSSENVNAYIRAIRKRRC